MKVSKTGVLLTNLGTPEAPTLAAVRNFLKEFLTDPFVIDLPFPIRQLLVRGIILPFRTAKSTEAYQLIWDPEKGSPLSFHTQALGEKLQQVLGEDYVVVVGMRYGKPSIAAALSALRACGVDAWIALPLFPQYALSSTQTALEHTMQLSDQEGLPSPLVIPHFYNDPDYIHAQAAAIAPLLQPNQHLLLSYHSLPVRHIRKTATGCDAACMQKKPCPAITEKTQLCYRAQCFETSRLLARALDLPLDRYSVAFQSQLGRASWIGPSVAQVMQSLRAANTKNLLVACPSFVTDCLETVEEMGIRGKQQWQNMGGEEYTLAPCMNTQDPWVNALAKMLLNRH